MIEKLTIRNFQAHARMSIPLGPGITTITGTTDSGKSSIVRSLRWVCLNRPSGEAFVRSGKSECCVELEVDGHTVRRIRGKKNLYEVDGRPLAAFGSVPPRDVNDILCVDEVNFQGQHDAPFWFSDSAGEVSRKLNDIVDLGIIDWTLGRLNARCREASAEEAVLERRIAEGIGRRKELDACVEMDADLKEVEALSEEVDVLTRRSRELSVRISHVAQMDRELKELREVEVPDTSGIERMVRELEEKQENKESLDALIDGIVRLRKGEQEAVERHSQLAKQLRETIGDTCPVCGNPVRRKKSP